MLIFLKKTKKFEMISWTNNTSDKIKVKCLNCNFVFLKDPKHCVSIQEETFCPNCGRNGGAINKELAQKRVGEDYKIIEYKGWSRRESLLQHKCGHIFSQKLSRLQYVLGCPKCFKGRSKGEVLIEKFLIKNHFSFEREKTFVGLPYLKYDFFLPEERILIEYQGEQHYRAIECWGGEEKLLAQKENDKKKRDFAKDKGYFLLEIPYWDFKKAEELLFNFISSTTILRK